MTASHCAGCDKKLDPSCQKGLIPRCPACLLEAQQSALAFVQQKSWRWELTIINHLMECLHNFDYGEGEDLLFELVKLGQLNWFGAEEPEKYRYRRPTKFEGMLKYRVPSK